MQRLKPWNVLRLIALTAALTLVASACGNGDDGGNGSANGGGGGGDAVIEQQDLSGISITVGSKDFTEQIVLGEIAVQAFEAAGANVTNRTNLGGTVVNRDALLAGEIDAYWEYNGTGWTVHLGQEDPSFDPEELTTQVREMDLEENDIVWIGRSPFNNTYGFATGPDFLDDGEPFTLQSMADYLKANPDATVCLETEFPNRPDGLVLFEEATGYDVPESQIETLETGVIYQETASGNCDFGEIFTTDGRIPGLDLNLVEDPGVFILYNVSMNMRQSVYEQAPEEFDAIVEAILELLDQDTMAELNARVSVEGEDASDVAEDFLKSNDLIS